jgi:hypothetical protein
LGFLLAFSFIDPIWVDRYMVPGLGALVVLVAYGLTRVSSTRALAVVLALTVAAASWGVARWYSNPGLSGFTKIANTIEDHLQPGDALVLATDRTRVPLEFALRHHADLRRGLEPAYPRQPWGEFHVGEQTGVTLPASVVRALSQQHERVWLLAGFYDPDEQINEALRRLRSRYSVVMRREVSGPMYLYLLERPS